MWVTSAETGITRYNPSTDDYKHFGQEPYTVSYNLDTITKIAEGGGLQDYVTIYVPAYQAAYLTQNLYDPETYEQDNLEWDSIIYAKPSEKAG